MARQVGVERGIGRAANWNSCGKEVIQNNTQPPARILVKGKARDLPCKLEGGEPVHGVMCLGLQTGTGGRILSEKKWGLGGRSEKSAD